jgi:hypothetical protein
LSEAGVSYPKVTLPIRSPGQLTGVLRDIKRALAVGSLHQFRPADAALALVDLSAVNEEGPWPDYVEAYFRDPKSGESYKLTVDAYHGAGGSWERLSRGSCRGAVLDTHQFVGTGT